MPNDWIVTLPQGIAWEDYTRELAAVADGVDRINYRVAYPPRDLAAGDRMFVTWRGKVRGWQAVVGVQHWPDGFRCQTTGAVWGPGWYIQRSGPFHAWPQGHAVPGFRGVRRLTIPYPF